MKALLCFHKLSRSRLDKVRNYLRSVKKHWHKEVCTMLMGILMALCWRHCALKWTQVSHNIVWCSKHSKILFILMLIQRICCYETCTLRMTSHLRSSPVFWFIQCKRTALLASVNEINYLWCNMECLRFSTWLLNTFRASVRTCTGLKPYILRDVWLKGILILKVKQCN